MSSQSQAVEDRRDPSGGDRRPDLSPARNVRPGFFVKLVLVALINAFLLYTVLAGGAGGSWGIVAFSAVLLVAVDYVYFSRRAVPAKYLVPGLVFLVVYQIFAMAYTGIVAFTNYGDGHNSGKADAVEAILVQNETRVPGSATYPLSILDGAGGLTFAVVDDGVAKLGSADQPLHDVPDATVENGRVTAVPGYTVLRFADIAARQADIVALRVPLSDDPAAGSLRTQDGSTAFVATSTLVYDAQADTMTDTATGVVYRPNDHGNFESADGAILTPGWRVGVGFENFTSLVTDSRIAGPFVQILLWTFAFAFLSVFTTFALGLFLAIVFNDPRVKGRRLYRSLLILPYAFPAFLSILVWRGLLNPSFGFINQVLLGGADIPWTTDPWLAKVAILMVNLWLGFPYMFLICTGALQAIPSDVIESARMDGAGPLRIFRSMTLPLLMISVAPLLIASFAFNFNNFQIIYMLTGGGPNFDGVPLLIGHTDILISMVYSVAFESGVKQYGLASALSVLIFAFVGLISWLGFRRTRTLEEL